MKTWEDKLEEQMGFTKEQEKLLAEEAVNTVIQKIKDGLFAEAVVITTREHMQTGRYKEFGISSEAIYPFVKEKMKELYAERSDEIEKRIIEEASAVYTEKANEILTKFLCQKLWNQQLVQFNMMAAEYRICKDCGEEFGMRLHEIEFFKNRNLKMPVRCPKCRQLRKTTIENTGNISLKHGCTYEQGVKNIMENTTNSTPKTSFSAMAEALRKAGKV